jgi:outer membrane immunogenic protein
MQRIFITLATATAFTVASAATVLAADMTRPVYKAPPPAPALYSWTGYYVGIHGGGAWSDTDWFYPCSATNIPQPPCDRPQGGHSGASWLAGGQVGTNYQVGQWVWGIEAEFSATRILGDNLDINFPIDALHSRTNFIGTVAPRLGLAWNRALIYAKGGAAWVHDDYWLSITQSGLTTVTADATRWGWMAGLGIEYALAQNWSAKVEYDYLDFGTKRVLLISNGAIPGQLSFDEDIRRKIQVVKGGLNYKFDWGAPLAGKY